MTPEREAEIGAMIAGGLLVGVPRAVAVELLAEVDQLRGRLRTTCQLLVEAVGADGPCNAEDAAARAVAELARMRPVVEATVAWERNVGPRHTRTLHAAIDAYRAGECTCPNAVSVLGWSISVDVKDPDCPVHRADAKRYREVLKLLLLHRHDDLMSDAHGIIRERCPELEGE